MEESVTALAGPKGKHNPDRAAVRHGHERGVGDPWWAAGGGPAVAGARRRRLR